MPSACVRVCWPVPMPIGDDAGSTQPSCQGFYCRDRLWVLSRPCISFVGIHQVPKRQMQTAGVDLGSRDSLLFFFPCCFHCCFCYCHGCRGIGRRLTCARAALLVPQPGRCAFASPLGATRPHRSAEMLIVTVRTRKYSAILYVLCVAWTHPNNE